MGEVFASAPFVVGKSEPSPVDSHIPAEETLCPVLANDLCRGGGADRGLRSSKDRRAAARLDLHAADDLLPARRH
jgi:hypothetical protein